MLAPTPKTEEPWELQDQAYQAGFARLKQDAERWRFAVKVGFPRFNNTLPESATPWYFYNGKNTFDGATPTEAIDCAIAATKEKP